MSRLSVLTFEHVPERLPHRGQQLSTIETALRGIPEGRGGRPVRIHGPSGAGKTTVAHFAAREAAREYGIGNAAVDCLRNRTRAAVLRTIARELGLSTVHASTPPTALHDFFREHVDAAVVVLDEAGQLKDTAVIQEVYAVDGLTPIIITNDADRFGMRIDESLTSRLQDGPLVACPRYTVSELVEILTARLREGGLETQVSAEAIEFTAEAVNGNARRGLSVLSTAFDAVGHDGWVTVEDVAAAEEEAFRSVVRRNLGELDTEHHVLYRLIADAGELQSGALKAAFERYFEVSDRDRRRYLEALEYHDAIVKEGQGRGTVYRARVDIDIGLDLGASFA